MNNELQQKLADEFPEFFAEPPKRMMKMGGVECGDGWFNLIRDLCQKIKAENPPKEFKVSQIKEKFGGLRFYVNWSTDRINSLIDEAEHASYNVCVECGSQYSINVDHWRSKCESCAALPV